MTADNLKMLGFAVTGPYRGSDHGTRACEEPEVAAVWDRPDHLPWVVVSQTLCLREDLGRADPVLDEHLGAPSRHTCRLKHVHTGSRHDVTREAA